MRKIKIGVFVGSLRKNSYTRLVAKTLSTLAPECLELEFIELDNLEMYNQDFDDEGTPPASWIIFRDIVKKMDAFLFVTPEYNRSVPGVLKNALDVGSRPYGQSVWAEKPGAVIRISPGAVEANHHLRQSLVFLNIPTIQQREAYIGNANSLYDTKANLINDETREFFQVILDAYVVWINKNLTDALRDPVGKGTGSKRFKQDSVKSAKRQLQSATVT